MNGIIPLIYKRIICVLWKGHNYIPVSPEDLDGKRLFECKYCKKTTCIVRNNYLEFDYSSISDIEEMLDQLE